MKLARTCTLLAAGALCAQGYGQNFVNGNFESQDMTGWTITLGPNSQYSHHRVLLFDIDDSGPGGRSYAAQFSVGQASNESNVYRGISITQSLALQAGTTYQFSYDWAAHNYFFLGNFDGGVFDLVVDGATLDTFDVDIISEHTTEHGTLQGTFTPAVTGQYEVGSRITRRFPPPFPTEPNITLGQYIDNFNAEPVPEPASMAALAFGVATLAYRRRKRNLN